MTSMRANQILAQPLQPARIELRSIDYVPERERHGHARHRRAIWFVANIGLNRKRAKRAVRKIARQFNDR
ncbi:MAG: hypothetical protein Q8K82_15920 [Gemmatimonadaceae bacterium]|nr:hypothetical protein [Gemmatimonadaceae bacterium]